MEMGWLNSSLIFCFWFASVLPPPPLVYGFSAAYNPPTDAEGRRFGGYRIVPKSCKDPTSHGKGSGVCMFNYECTKKNGTVVGSCMDGFLFGACCRLPPQASVNFVALNVNNVYNEAPTATQKTSTTRSDNTDLNSATTVHSNADTVLLHENGTIANEAYRPEDFEFNSKPELFVATDATPAPPSRQSTNQQKSTVWKSTTENWLLSTKRKPSWTSQSEENLVQISTISAGTAQNSDSINHILAILDDTRLSSQEEQNMIASESSTASSLSTWVSVDSKPTVSYRPTPSYSQQTPKYPASTSFSTSAPHHTKPYYTSSIKPVPTTTSKPHYTTNKHSPSYPTTFYGPTQSSYHSTKKPATTYYTSSKPASIYTQSPQIIYNSKPSTSIKRPSTTTQYVQGPGFQVSITPKPSTTPEPVPTVIVLGPIHSTKKPAAPPVATIITVNPEGNVVTYKPASAATAKPIYHGVNHGPLFTTIKPQVSTHGTTGSYYRPTHSTPTEVIKDNIPNSTELFAFPPVRDPNANLSQTNPPEVASWMTPSTIVQDEETAPPLVEDDKLDNKVHTFVEKIVQSLQGNFEDLEQVLIDGESTPNVTVSSYAPPVKRPSTTKKPSKPKPSKKPTTASSYYPTRPPSRPTPPLITRPPPRPATTKKPITTKKPQLTGTTIFLEDTEQSYVPSSTETPSYSSTTEIDYRRECGVRPLMKQGRIVGGKGATFGEWPWQVLVREATWLGLFTKNKCGGVLITNKYVITAAHCQPGFLASLVAVFGEYDISGELESKRSVSKNVKRVIVHRHYDAATFENDIALLELESPVAFDQHIVPICMPDDEEDFTGRMASVTGWGRLRYGGGVPSVLQEVQVPVMENNVCQEMFHTAGHSKTILHSFICAGYANGQRDSCEGDSGGPLMIERPNGHWVLAGTVSHGIKCAAPYLPGVYMRTTYYKPWLHTITGVK